MATKRMALVFEQKDFDKLREKKFRWRDKRKLKKLSWEAFILIMILDLRMKNGNVIKNVPGLKVRGYDSNERRET